MTFTELHEILDDENKKLSPTELRQVIYELKQDAFNELIRCEIGGFDYKFYEGEQNAFQIVLDLLEHLKGEENADD